MRRKKSLGLFYSNIKYINKKAKVFSLKSFICTLLVFALVISSLNMNCLRPLFASNESILQSTYGDNLYSEVENLNEVENLRTRNSKTFMKANGSYELSIYGEDIHFLENGKHIEIDNTISLDGNHYKNARNKFDLRLNQDPNLYSSIEYDGMVLEWKINTNNRFKNRSVSSNKLDFSDVFGNNTKLEYISLNNGVKENIILDNYIKKFSFSYNLRTKLEIKEVNNKLLLFDGESHKFTINDYFMYDSFGTISYDIDYKINQIDDNEYKINVIPSDEYL